MSSERLPAQTTFALLDAAGRAQRSMIAASTEFGVRLRELRLLALVHRQGPLSQRELTRFTGIDKSPMVGLVDALEAKGLAVRERDSADRRVTKISLTHAGHLVLQRAMRELRDPDVLLEALDAAERRSLHELLLRIVDDSSQA
jgi:DNA-binding MarR family transcriptional regulator